MLHNVEGTGRETLLRMTLIPMSRSIMFSMYKQNSSRSDFSIRSSTIREYNLIALFSKQKDGLINHILS